MNWNYISGFFDADGSISLMRANKGCNKTLQVSFSNCEKLILESIKDYINKETGATGHISSKKKKEEHHSQNYDLKYTYNNGYLVMSKINSLHPKKIHRWKVYQQIQECTPRNGKYTEEQRAERSRLEALFFVH